MTFLIDGNLSSWAAWESAKTTIVSRIVEACFPSGVDTGNCVRWQRRESTSISLRIFPSVSTIFETI